VYCLSLLFVPIRHYCYAANTTFSPFCLPIIFSNFSFYSLAAYNNGCVLLIIFRYWCIILSGYITIFFIPVTLVNIPLYDLKSVSSATYIVFWNTSSRMLHFFLKSGFLQSVMLLRTSYVTSVSWLMPFVKASRSGPKIPPLSGIPVHGNPCTSCSFLSFAV
jgi:hypothetical protein